MSDRARCSPGSSPNEDQPRLIMRPFRHSSARDKVLKVAKEKSGVEWNGCNICPFSDMTMELADRRNAFTATKHLLCDQSMKL